MSKKFEIYLIIAVISIITYCTGEILTTDELLSGDFRAEPKIERINVSNSITIIVIFDQVMNTDDIIQKTNYSINDLNDDILEINTISLIQGEGDRFEIKTDPQIPAMTYTLTVKNVRDKKGKAVGKKGISAKFEGFNISAEFVSTPPVILAPENGQKIINISQNTVKLIWTSKYGASVYTVEVAADDDSVDPFLVTANHLEGSPFSVVSDNADEPPPAFLEISLPDAYTYRWRVRADTTTEGEWSQVEDESGNLVYPSFHAFDDTVYVWCPAEEDSIPVLICSEDTDEDGTDDTLGNKGKPFRTFYKALVDSVSLGIEVHVANRDAINTPYTESFSLIQGIAVELSLSS